VVTKYGKFTIYAVGLRENVIYLTINVQQFVKLVRGCFGSVRALVCVGSVWAWFWPSVRGAMLLSRSLEETMCWLIDEKGYQVDKICGFT
jgi:hypothetical protein